MSGLTGAVSVTAATQCICDDSWDEINTQGEITIHGGGDVSGLHMAFFWGACLDYINVPVVPLLYEEQDKARACRLQHRTG